MFPIEHGNKNPRISNPTISPSRPAQMLVPMFPALYGNKRNKHPPTLSRCPTMECSNRVVVLKGGVSVMLPALQLALQLENPGFRFRVLDDGRLEVQPCQQLTNDDARAIRSYRD